MNQDYQGAGDSISERLKWFPSLQTVRGRLYDGLNEVVTGTLESGLAGFGIALTYTAGKLLSRGPLSFGFDDFHLESSPQAIAFYATYGVVILDGLSKIAGVAIGSERLAKDGILKPIARGAFNATNRFYRNNFARIQWINEMGD